MKVKEISNEELHQKMNLENIVIVDVREEEEHDEGHIPDATLIPLGQLANRYHELGKEEMIYVICHSGGRSAMACHFLQQKGYKNVVNVVEGMCKWNGKIVK